MIKRTLLFLLFFSGAVYAGGSSFDIRITSIETHDTKFHIVGDVFDNFDYDSSGCKSIIIKGYFDSADWKKYDKFINKESHLEALAILQKARDQATSINFGYIGAGLKRVGTCEYRSKALFYDEHGVFSVYTRI